MIFLRLDERLVHGQVTTGFLSVLGITHMVVANDEVAKDAMQRQLLRMGVPESIRMMMLSIDDAADVLNDERCSNLNVLVVCKNPHDVLRLLEKTPAIKDVNLANYGFQVNDGDGAKRFMLTSNLSVDAKELEDVKKILAKDLKCYCQVIANQTQKPIVIKQ